MHELYPLSPEWKVFWEKLWRVQGEKEILCVTQICGLLFQTEAVDTEEVAEIEEDDREKFADQLCSIGALARVVLDQCLPLMAT